MDSYFWNIFDIDPVTHRFYYNKTLAENTPNYAGVPSPEIDKSWDDILEGKPYQLPIQDGHGERNVLMAWFNHRRIYGIE
jgi:hypothetical protein